MTAFLHPSVCHSLSTSLHLAAVHLYDCFTNIFMRNGVWMWACFPQGYCIGYPIFFNLIFDGKFIYRVKSFAVAGLVHGNNIILQFFAYRSLLFKKSLLLSSNKFR